VVPPVMGETVANATTMIEAVDNLTVNTAGQMDEYHDTIAAGSVIRTNPAAGMAVDVGTAIDLVVSLGRPDVPDVTGETVASATAMIMAVDGLTVDAGAQMNEFNDMMIAAGSVIRTIPAAGTAVDTGSSVVLVVSLGPTPIVNVPNVVNETEADATTAIEAVGLKVGTTSTGLSDTIAVGSVISTDPTAGSSVLLGSSVNLVIASGPATTTVPSVIGQEQEDAEMQITTASLSVGAVTEENSATVASGIVLDQSPAGNTSAAVGSAVDLTVSLGALVPSVVGISQGDADAQIVAAGLVPGKTTTERNNFVAAGFVVSQTPAGNTNAEPGNFVDLIISTGAFSTGAKDGNALDPWTLLLLMAVPLLRRRRR
jgi:serine/threonine-protein kinase